MERNRHDYRINISPNGEYVLVTALEKPFSYLVPYSRFPSKTVVYDKDGNEVKVLLEAASGRNAQRFYGHSKGNAKHQLAER
jgi:hypothetical protein